MPHRHRGCKAEERALHPRRRGGGKGRGAPFPPPPPARPCYARPIDRGAATSALGRDCAKVLLVEINELLNVFDRAAANLDKLDKIWQRAGPMLPSGPA